MSDMPLVKKYIDSVNGMAHQSAIEIIINLEKKLETAGTYADGYENGYQAGMAEKKEWVGLTDDEVWEILWETQSAELDAHGDQGSRKQSLCTLAIQAKLKEKNCG